MIGILKSGTADVVFQCKCFNDGDNASRAGSGDIADVVRMPNICRLGIFATSSTIIRVIFCLLYSDPSRRSGNVKTSRRRKAPSALSGFDGPVEGGLRVRVSRPICLRLEV